MTDKNNINHIANYTTANDFPIKILQNKELVCDIVDNKHIPLKHIQLCPTNMCNLNCSFCSNRDVDKNAHWNKNDIDNIVFELSKTKCSAATITGGGEPTLNENISYLIKSLIKNDIEVGIITNGLSNDFMTNDALHMLTWVRFSFSDIKYINNKFMHVFDFYKKNTNLSISISYVVTNNINYNNILSIMNYANSNEIDSIKFVNDIFMIERYGHHNIKKFLIKNNIDDKNVIYNDKRDFSTGSKKCYISLLKPMIAADGYVYPCCGTQIATKDTLKKYPTEMRMCHFSDLHETIQNEKYFDGSKCIKCCYDNYNIFLNMMINKCNHHKFI